ncbi:hypothetical protein IIB79_09450 [candidate division KSB1 bacterium]|nr:hypothetical protein [candidate division KSB1 bacterium]
MRYKTKSLICLFVMLSFNCSSTETDPFIDSMLAKGIDAKLVSAYPESGSPLFSFEEVLSLGGDVPNPQLFQPVERCLVDDEGNIYFNDERRVKKFSPEGNFLHYLGDIGEGPGEILWPVLVSIVNDLVYLGDRQSFENFEVFSTDGEYMERMKYKEVKNELMPKKRYTSILYLGNDKFLFEGNQYETREDGFLFRDRNYGFADREGIILKNLDINMEPIITEFFNGNLGMQRPLTPEKCPVIFRDNLYMLSRNGKDIYIFNRAGDLLKVFRLNTLEQVTSQEDIDEIYERTRRSSDPGLISILDLVGIPETKPAVCDIIVDDNDLIWLRRGDTFRNYNTAIRDEKFTYVILTQDGEYLGDQVLPVKLSTVKGGYAYGFLKTEDGFSVFKKYRLQMN